MNTKTYPARNGAAASASLVQKETLVVGRGEVELGVAAMRPDHTFESGIAKIDTAIMEVVVRLVPWRERTRFVPLEGPGRDETVRSLLAHGYSHTKLEQAVTLRESCWFPFRTVSFVCCGDVFPAPVADGAVRDCHILWNHQERRFELVPVDGGWQPQLFEAFTRVEEHPEKAT